MHSRRSDGIQKVNVTKMSPQAKRENRENGKIINVLLKVVMKYSEYNSEMHCSWGYALQGFHGLHASV